MIKVLVVEDYRNWWEILRELIEENGGQAVSAMTITEARALFATQEFSCILMDGRLGGNWPNTCPLIKEIRQAGFTGTIIATSNDDDYRQEMLDCGCDHKWRKYGGKDEDLLKLIGLSSHTIDSRV